MAIGIGISPFLGIKSSAVTLGTTIATTHYNRVIADGVFIGIGIRI
jgi:hypothetical protein